MFGDLDGDALAFGHAVIGLPKVAVTRVLLDIHHVVVLPFLEAQAKLHDALGDDHGPANQGGAGHLLVDHDLRGPQHAFFFALGVADALFGSFAGGVEDRLHRRARGIHKTLQAFLVGLHVGDGAQGHAAVGSRLGHGRRDFHHQARIKRAGYQVLGAECQLFA